MDFDRTKWFYNQMNGNDLCYCAYCQNYIREVKSAYPKLSEYLSCLGVDIEKPFENTPLEPDESGYLEYSSSQYIVFGTPDDFMKATVGSVTVDIAKVHPSTTIKEPHFVIEIYNVRLKWAM